MSSFQSTHLGKVPPPLPPFKPIKSRAGQPQVKKAHVGLREASRAVPVKKDPWTVASPRDNPETAIKTTFWAIHGRIQHESQAAYEAAKGVALGRIRAIVGDAASDAEVEDIMSRLADTLRAAEVTVNFNAKKWFANENTSGSYTQMFECGPIKATQSGGVVSRDFVEQQKIVLPVAPRRADVFANCATRFGRTEGMYRQDFSSDEFLPNNAHFVGATRPRYAALNFTGDRNGAAAADGKTYGYSVLVWKDDVKRRATFCPADSFNATVGAKDFCTYDTMEVMLAWLDDDLFQDLYDVACRNVPAKPRMTRFIECHIYEPMRFRGMLDHIRVSHQEMPVWHDKYRCNIELNLDKFCKANGTRWMWA